LDLYGYLTPSFTAIRLREKDRTAKLGLLQKVENIFSEFGRVFEMVVTTGSFSMKKPVGSAKLMKI
jgi:hypothetical protein